VLLDPQVARGLAVVVLTLVLAVGSEIPVGDGSALAIY
jgi:hypothetical protein